MKFFGQCVVLCRPFASLLSPHTTRQSQNIRKNKEILHRRWSIVIACITKIFPARTKFFTRIHRSCAPHNAKTFFTGRCVWRVAETQIDQKRANQ
jgi:hypothetical protein